MPILGLSEGIVRQLRDEIITGVLAPGSRLNEADIAARLGVSRAPVREAYRVLANSHFIVHLPRRGAYVADLSVENLKKVYDARSMIENFAMDVLERKDIRVLPKVEKALEAAAALKFPELDDKDAMLNYVMTFRDFHVALIESTENDWVISFYKGIAYALARYQFICLYIQGLTSNSYEMHEKILTYLRKGEYDSARSCLFFHIDHTVSLIKQEIGKRAMPQNVARG